MATQTDPPPAEERLPMAIRDDFRDMARLRGYGADEIEDFIEGRMPSVHDTPPDDSDAQITWKSLEGMRVECVDYLASRQALAAIARSGARPGEPEVSRDGAAAYPAHEPSLRADPELHAQALARALEQRGAGARRR